MIYTHYQGNKPIFFGLRAELVALNFDLFGGIAHFQ
jgi:hypothetical protein